MGYRSENKRLLKELISINYVLQQSLVYKKIIKNENSFSRIISHISKLNKTHRKDICFC